jgi:hypothetical protein
MKRYLSVAVILLLLLSGCRIPAPFGGAPKTDALPDGTIELAPLPPLASPGISPSPETSASQAPSATPSPSPKPADQAKDADWLMQVDDTQDYTHPKSGILYHCNLYIYTTKSGGKDVLGEYTGQFVFKMEPDAKSIQELFGEDDAVIDSFTGANLIVEANAAVFTLQNYSDEAYSDGMKTIMPDQPLLQMPPDIKPDAMALELIDAKFRYEESSLTAHDKDGGSGEGWAPGMSKSVSEPIVLEIRGGTAYVTLPRYGLDRAFKGTLVGTVK